MATKPERAKYKAKSRCAVKYCRNNKAKRGSVCHKHRQAAWRKNNPVSAALAKIRDRAKRKGIYFDITLEQFKEFCAEHGYPAVGMHLDREIATEGYTIDNIQVLTAANNIAKGNRERTTEEYKAYYVQRKLFVRKSSAVNVDTSATVAVDTLEDDDVDTQFSVDVDTVPLEAQPF